MQRFSINKITFLIASVFVSAGPAVGATIQVEGPYPYVTQSNMGTHGMNGGSEGAGAGYVFLTAPGSTAADNLVSVGSGVKIVGGVGYVGGHGGAGMTGSNLTITNAGGSVTGGIGGIPSGNDGDGGDGGAGISGSNLSIANNSGAITGGAGGTSGYNSGNSGSGGAGIFGSGLDITNGGSITGGKGGYLYANSDDAGGAGGAGISGNGLSITNNSSGTISGGQGAEGGRSGAGISGSDMTIINNGKIVGAYGSFGYADNSGANSMGGAGISGSDLTIINNRRILGGEGNSGGAGGDGIFGSGLKITNSESITGGKGGFGYGESTAGVGGAGISGSDMTIDNIAGGSITGGEGGYGGLDGVGGATMPAAGGVGILGDNLKITNAGSVTGGVGGFAGGETTSPDGADGGAGIFGSNLTINNLASGTITGGAGYYSGSRDNTNSSDGGNGAAGISGDSLTINNSGSIVGGKGDVGSNGGAYGNGGAGISGSNLTIVNNSAITGGTHGGNSGEKAAAISLTGGSSSLTLNTGSNITGDITLADGTSESATTLRIVGNDEDNRAINGGLLVGQWAGVVLAERPIEFSGSATFAEGASLTLGGGVSLKAESVSVGADASLNANILHWDQHDILLVETTNGITGTFSYNNALVAGMSQPDFAYINTGSQTIKYSLYWNGQDSDAHGTFTLDEGSSFNLGVALADNAVHTNPSWDGKSLTKAGKGTLILSAENTYTGSTHINEGMLKTTTSNAFAHTSGVTIGEAGTLNLNGNGQIVNALDNRGTLLIDDYGVPPASPLSVTLVGDVTNGGSIILNNSATSAGNTLTINGDYVGDGGSLSLGTVLGGDSSLTDRLVVTGNASGTTYVEVSNENGSGALLHEGIKIVETGGSTEDAFVQRGRIVAGSYEYRVQQGTALGEDMNSWYLTSMTDRVGSSDPSHSVHTYRPEGGSYASNLAAANTLFSTRLHDRQGGSWYTDPVTGERHMTSMWLRTSGGHSQGRMSDGQNKSSANRVVVQLGGDLAKGSVNGTDRYHLGAMAGYGRQDSNTHNRLSGYRSQGDVSGYSAGLYGTWYQNATEKTGLYVDSWMLYNWFDNTVKGDEIASESYKSKGLTASIESGYAFHIGSFATEGDMANNVYIRPQAQVTWMGVRADDHTERNGTRVQGQGNDNVQTRLGMRLYVNGKSALDKNTVREFEPFIEANWIYNSKQYGVRMKDTSTHIQGSRNVGEVKVGVEGRLTQGLSVWGNVAQQAGNKGFRDTGGMLGIKYQF
ncbi:autotransporter outer membrane beta-barrel domain-containing protein [Leminorella grimontii]|uniref:autotransporter outer membrane beta-barrel domain-containing protein n=1 Tax=Leminorella grimontii TaxID=82981 RepID=UPI002085C857|nr:autotransporter outer membrane beta-barrel domain-containing protein [Leminorella grimontii]GKX59520.1 outer membrane protein IcsA autotransporter [Leminorella grimontii]